MTMGVDVFVAAIGRGLVVTKRRAAITCLLLLSGCTSAVTEASPAAVVQRVQALSAVRHAQISPRGYAIGAMREIDGACASFFDNIAQLRQNTGFAHDLLQVALPASNGALAAAKASAATIAKWTAGISVVDAAVQAFPRDYTYSQFLFQIKTSVEVTMQNSQADLLDGLSDQTSAPMDDYVKADFGVRRYARYCSISSIEALAAAALVNANLAVVSKTDDQQKPAQNANTRVGLSRTPPPLVRIQHASSDVPQMPVYSIRPPAN